MFSFLMNFELILLQLELYVCLSFHSDVQVLNFLNLNYASTEYFQTNFLPKSAIMQNALT